MFELYSQQKEILKSLSSHLDEKDHRFKKRNFLAN